MANLENVKVGVLVEWYRRLFLDLIIRNLLRNALSSGNECSTGISVYLGFADSSGNLMDLDLAILVFITVFIIDYCELLMSMATGLQYKIVTVEKDDIFIKIVQNTLRSGFTLSYSSLRWILKMTCVSYF